MRRDPIDPRPMTAGEAMVAPDFVLEDEAMNGDMEAEIELDRRQRKEEMRRQEELARIEEKEAAAAAAAYAYEEQFTQDDSGDDSESFDLGLPENDFPALDLEINLCSACESILKEIDLNQDEEYSPTVNMCMNDDCDQSFESDPKEVPARELF